MAAPTKSGVGGGALRAVGSSPKRRTVTGWLVRVLIGIVALALLAWGALALHFAGPRSMADPLAVAWLIAGLAMLLFVRPLRVFSAAFTVAVGVLLVWWSTILPRNDRAWQPDVARPAHAEVDGDRLTIHNVRNFDYRSETDFTERWETRTYDLSRIDRLDFFMSYWAGPSIAHTIMSWGFTDGQHLAISIETRKEVGETYSAVSGFFKQFELYYVVADERDVIRLRTNFRGEHVYLYPLRTPRDRARRALLQYVSSFDTLAEEPAFYNAGNANCTTTIRTNIQHMGLTMPFDWRLLVNGHLDEMLYERHIIDTSRPFAEVKAGSLIDDRAKAADQDPDFSRKIREGLVVPKRFDETGEAPAYQ
jgi:hypothetical protein